ncbi:hypothetical protein SpCBS45565_g01014 [Spizellomyces sp. 'palustris']|nr:hypothetical protein SpCBS45565_g01014 [Spizellomyces sp. 'palustris']
MSPLGRISILFLPLLIIFHIRPVNPVSIPASRPYYQPSTCNGFAELCHKRYDEVCFGVTHNAFAVAPLVDATANIMKSAVNQDPGYILDYQLEDGYRGFKVAVWQNKTGAVHLCHGKCENSFISYDAGPFVTFLTSIRRFLDSNRNEIVTVFLENVANLDANTMASQFDAAHLTPYVYVPPDESPIRWYTLQDMIVANTRLVVFMDKHCDLTQQPWLLRQSMYVTQNNYRNYFPEPQFFNCEPYPNHRSDRRSLTLLNHQLNILIAEGSNGRDDIYKPDYYDRVTTNSLNSIFTHISTCTDKNVQVTFVSVDWGASGQTIAAIDAYNGVSRPGKARSYDAVIHEASRNLSSIMEQAMRSAHRYVEKDSLMIGIDTLLKTLGVVLGMGVWGAITILMAFGRWW